MAINKPLILRGAVAVGAVALLAALVQPAISGRKSDEAKSAAEPLPLVSVVRAEARDLPVKLAAHGHVVPLNQVDVRPQVGGTVRGVHFHEGDEIKVGQLLFTIDASDVSAQLERSQASAAQIEAQVDAAERDLARMQQLARLGYYSPIAVDTSASKLESLKAQYKAVRAEVASSGLLVARTRITASMAGLTGALAVHPGSLAQTTSAVPLVTVVQMDPIGVDFSLPESQLARLLAAHAAGTVHIGLRMSDGSRLPGSLVFINNTVNTDSGTITLKASFANSTRSLWPGTYVELDLDAGVSPGAIVLPPQAVLEGPQGRFVYVLGGDNRAQVQPVELLRLQDQMAVVSGLKGGELVVSEGLLGLKPGSPVRIAASTAKDAR